MRLSRVPCTTLAFNDELFVSCVAFRLSFRLTAVVAAFSGEVPELRLLLLCFKFVVVCYATAEICVKEFFSLISLRFMMINELQL